MPKTTRRRRKERKTDYKARLALLKSGRQRIVIRKTNRHIIVQIVETEIAQDKVLFGITSEALLKSGWPEEKKGSLKSKPAAYATGYLLGKMAKGDVKDELVLDMGMHRNIHKSRIYAALKGAIDAGLKVSHKDDVLPTLEEIKSNEMLAPLVDKVIK